LGQSDCASAGGPRGGETPAAVAEPTVARPLETAVTAVLDDAVLAHEVHQNVAAALDLIGSRVAGSLVARLDGVLAVNTGLPVLLFNQVMPIGDDTPPDRVAVSLEAGVDALRERGARFVVTLRGGLDDALLPLVRRLGLEPLSETPWMPGMAKHPLTPRVPLALPPGHEIRRVDGAAGLADHAEVAAAGFGMPRAWVDAVMTDSLAREPGVAVYVGYQDGSPVTSGMGVQTGTTIGVYNIATVEAARGRGYGSAMTMRVVDDGAAAGCDTAILQASEMGQPIYERLGFRTVVDYFGYAEPRAG
jgi:GNAT superfamily N-acetyltransferase